MFWSGITSVFLAVSGRHPHTKGTITIWKGTITILTGPAVTGADIGGRASLLQDHIDRFVLQVFMITLGILRRTESTRMLPGSRDRLPWMKTIEAKPRQILRFMNKMSRPMRKMRKLLYLQLSLN